MNPVAVDIIVHVVVKKIVEVSEKMRRVHSKLRGPARAMWGGPRVQAMMPSEKRSGSTYWGGAEKLLTCR